MIILLSNDLISEIVAMDGAKSNKSGPLVEDGLAKGEDKEKDKEKKRVNEGGNDEGFVVIHLDGEERGKEAGKEQDKANEALEAKDEAEGRPAIDISQFVLIDTPLGPFSSPLLVMSFISCFPCSIWTLGLHRM